jgi:hypothetical protein
MPSLGLGLALGLGDVILSGSPYDPDATAYFALRPSLNSGEKNAFNAFVLAGKSDGWWAQLGFIMPLMGGSFSDLFAALKGGVTPINHSFVSGDFNANGLAVGLLGDGSSKYIDTGYSGASLTLNNTVLSFFFNSNNGTTSAGEHGCYVSETEKLVVYPWDQYYSDIYGDSAGRLQVTNPTTPIKGLMSTSRTASNAMSVYQDQTSLGSIATTEGTIPALNIFIFSANGQPGFSPDKLCVFATGLGLSSTLLTLWTIRFYQLLNSIAVGGLSNYVFACFPNSQNNTGLLAVITGPDGLTWNQYRIARFVPSSPDNSSGDYSIIKYSDGYYYLAYTRSRNGATVLTSCGLSRSQDLIVWENLTDVDFSAVIGVARVWAPELFVDPASGLMNIVAAVSVTDDTGPFLIYQVGLSGTSFGTRTSPTLLTGLTGNHIDPFPVYRNGMYYIWLKNETTKDIEVWQATALTGPYTVLHIGDWMGIGSNNEGPCFIVLNGVDTLYYDNYGANFESYTQLTAGDWTTGVGTWSTPTAITAPFAVRHGTLIPKDYQGPVNTNPPDIESSNGFPLHAGSLLSVIDDTWSGNGITFTYAWTNSASGVVGTGSTYSVQFTDTGDNISCTKTATNAFGTASSTTPSYLINP